MGFNIVAPYMEFLHLNGYIAEWYEIWYEFNFPMLNPHSIWTPPLTLGLEGATQSDATTLAKALDRGKALVSNTSLHLYFQMKCVRQILCTIQG